MLPKIFGDVQKNNIWQIFYNYEIYNRYKQPDAVKVIQENQI